MSYSIQKDGTRQMPFDRVRELTRQGFEAWSKVQCSAGSPSLFVEELEPAACTKVEYAQGGKPNANIVLFRDDRWPHSDGVNTVALTTVTFNMDTGEIYDADVEINTYSRAFKTDPPFDGESYDYLSAITHEAGHFFGLAHSADPNATMYALYRPGSTTIRSLDVDDALGICDVYPISAMRIADGGPFLAECSPNPRGGFSSLCAADSPVSPPEPAPKQKSKGCAVALAGETEEWGVAFLALASGGLAFAFRRRRARTGEGGSSRGKGAA